MSCIFSGHFKAGQYAAEKERRPLLSPVAQYAGLHSHGLHAYMHRLARRTLHCSLIFWQIQHCNSSITLEFCVVLYANLQKKNMVWPPSTWSSLVPVAEDHYGRADTAAGLMSRSAGSQAATATAMTRSGGPGALGLPSPGLTGRHPFATFHPPQTAVAATAAGRPSPLMTKSAPAEGLEYLATHHRSSSNSSNNNNSTADTNKNDNASNNGTVHLEIIIFIRLMFFPIFSRQPCRLSGSSIKHTARVKFSPSWRFEPLSHTVQRLRVPRVQFSRAKRFINIFYS